MPDPNPTPDLAALAVEVLDRCVILARQTEEPGRITRRFLSEPMHAVHALVAGWMAEAGMTSRVDAAGNIIGRIAPAGCPDDAPTLVIGSHLDTVPDAGAYDGILGVLLGIAAVGAVGGQLLPYPVAVVGFSEEEGVRYRTPFLGSRAFVGTFDPAWLDLVDADGVTMAEAFRRFGLDPSRIGEAAWPHWKIGAFLEVHIEQGPRLEAQNWSLGLVGSIVGQSRLTVTFEGQAAHAGTTPMRRRRDAFLGAARWALAVEHLAGHDFPNMVGTVGAVAVAPGAGNVIPGSVTLSLDVRDPADESRRFVVGEMLTAARSIARHRGLGFRIDRQQDHPAILLDSTLIDELDPCLRAEDCPVFLLSSGAGHDAAILAEVAPTALLFVRSPGGISHHPSESVLPGDVLKALGAVVRFLKSWRPSAPTLETIP